MRSRWIATDDDLAPPPARPTPARRGDETNEEAYKQITPARNINKTKKKKKNEKRSYTRATTSRSAIYFLS